MFGFEPLNFDLIGTTPTLLLGAGSSALTALKPRLEKRMCNIGLRRIKAVGCLQGNLLGMQCPAGGYCFVLTSRIYFIFRN